MNKKIGFIGCGNMGSAMVLGILHHVQENQVQKE